MVAAEKIGALRLWAPGSRGGRNPFWLLRGRINGRDIEVSTKTDDHDAAVAFAREFERRAVVAFDERLAIDPDQIEMWLDLMLEQVTKGLDQLLGLRGAPLPESGVYFLFEGNVLRYVGQSHRLAARIRFHQDERKLPFDSWAAVPVPRRFLDVVEALYIARYQPFFNRGVRGRTNRE